MTVNDKSLDNLSGDARALWDAALALARLRPGVSLPPLLVFTDPLRVPDPTGVALRLPAGSGLVFRHFGTPSAEDTAWRLREITARRGIALMIGLDAELADRIGADGLHLPQRSRSTAPQVRKDHPQWLITAAAHVQGLADEADQTDQAIRETQGLDGLVLSPAFATRSPSPSRPPLGAAQITDFVSATKLPVYALGGINLTNVAQLSGTGICGIAGLEGFISLFCD